MLKIHECPQMADLFCELFFDCSNYFVCCDLLLLTISFDLWSESEYLFLGERTDQPDSRYIKDIFLLSFYWLAVSSDI